MRMGSLVLPLLLVAGCSSDDDTGDSPLQSMGGTFGVGGSAGSTVVGNGGSSFSAGGAVGAAGGTVGAGGMVGAGGFIGTGGGTTVSSGGTSTAGAAGASAGGVTGEAGAGDSGATGEAGAGPDRPDGGGMAGAGPGGGAQSLPPISDYAASGPFRTTSQANVGPGNNYTIYRPEPLGEDGFMHPPLIFGPGILTNAAMYQSLLEHLATHGYVSICVNSMTGGPNAPGNLEAMKTGLEWLIAQNDAAGPYQGKLAVNRAVTMGYSIGATASTQLSSHPAIATTVSIHGHNTSGDPHGPVLLLTGTDDVIDGNRTTLRTLEEAPAMLAALPIGHLDVIAEIALLGRISASARYIAPITAWLRYWVNGDDAAKRFFWGADCEMCKSPWIKPETNALWDAQTL